MATVIERINYHKNYVFKINLLKSVIYSVYYRSKIIIFRNTKVIIESKKVDINKICIGKNWKGLPYFKSAFVVRKLGKVTVKETFTCYNGCKIIVNKGANLELGSGYINNDVTIECFNSIKIGENVAIGPEVIIRDSDNHTIKYDGYNQSLPIVIEDGVWIGTRAIILKGVTIGKGSIIAAGAVVTKDIPQNSLAAGIPAQEVKSGIKWS